MSRIEREGGACVRCSPPVTPRVRVAAAHRASRACNAHKSCAEHRAHLPKAYLSAVDGEVVGQQSKGGAILAQSALLGPEVGAGGGG